MNAGTHERRPRPGIILSSAGLACVLFAACAQPERTKAQLQSAACEQAEKLSPDELERIYEQTKSELARNGVTIDADVWTSPDKLQQYIETFSKAAQCPSVITARGEDDEVGATQQGLHSTEIADYCGFGHGVTAVPSYPVLPGVSTCLNQACFQHDSCYARCSASTSTCLWADETDVCDQAFFEAADACQHQFGTKLVSWAVIRIAKGIKAVGGLHTGCGSPMRCPGAGEVGFGVCAVDQKSAACTECLARADGTCVERSEEATDPAHSHCSGAPDPLCVVADCPDYAGCWGPQQDPGATAPFAAGSVCKDSGDCDTGCCAAVDGREPRCVASTASVTTCICNTDSDCTKLTSCGGLPSRCDTFQGQVAKFCNRGCG